MERRAQEALLEVEATLAGAPSLNGNMFNVPRPIVRPWGYPNDQPQTWADPHINTSGSPLTPDGLMYAEKEDDFVLVDIPGASCQKLVSKSVAEKMGLLPPETAYMHAALVAGNDALLADGVIQLGQESHDAGQNKETQEKSVAKQEETPQAGGSVAAAVAEMAEMKAVRVECSLIVIS